MWWRGDGGACRLNSDCDDRENGRCVLLYETVDVYSTYSVYGCEYACGDDAGCENGQVCVHPDLTEAASRSRCVKAECKSGSDCASGECGLVDFSDDCGQWTELRCRDVNADACHGDGDCVHLGDRYSCRTELPGGAFKCLGQNCMPGRPLLVAGTPRVAPTVRRADWRDVTRPSEAS